MLYSDLERGKVEFDALRRLYIDGREKARALVLLADGSVRRFSGRIAAKQYGYGFVSSNELRFDAFFGKNSAKADVWDSLSRGCNVSFSLGFTFRGPVALDVVRLA
jgi:cold shock CspA family protein